jgi:hypothetical protein
MENTCINFYNEIEYLNELDGVTTPNPYCIHNIPISIGCNKCKLLNEMSSKVDITMRIEDPQDPEKYWYVSRVKVVEEHYFDNEKEAREFAKKHCLSVDEPVQQLITR